MLVVGAYRDWFAGCRGGALFPRTIHRLFNGSAAPTGKLTLPWRQSSGIYPDDPNAVDMVNVDEAYDADAANVVRKAHGDKKPFFYYFASHHTHAPQFAKCQSACDERGGECLSNCSSRRGLFGDSLRLLDTSVGRMHALLEELEIANNTLTIYSADVSLSGAHVLTGALLACMADGT